MQEEGAQSDSPEASDVEEVLYVAKEQTDIDPMYAMHGGVGGG